MNSFRILAATSAAAFVVTLKPFTLVSARISDPATRYPLSIPRALEANTSTSTVPISTLLMSPNAIEYWLTIESAYVNVTTANGASLGRSGSLINGTLPGPVLTATEGDTLIIHVRNNQDPSSREASLHWHGMLQPGTPFYDGTPGVSQCGICVFCEETYKFQATPAGTHWYHSHSGVQYADGQFGALIIYPREDAELPEWERMVEDEFIVLASEWSAVDPYTEFVRIQAGEVLGGTYDGLMEADVAWPNWLVNGKDGAEFNIESNKLYRFRFINGAANYGVNVSIAEHPMLLVMVDSGTYLDPSTVDYFRAEVGSRYDFVIKSTAAPGRYPIYIVDYSGVNVATPAVIVVDGGDTYMESGPASRNGIHNTPSYPSPLINVTLPPASRMITLNLTGTESMNMSLDTASMDMGAGSMTAGTSSTGMAGMDMGMGAESMNTGSSSTGKPAMDLGPEYITGTSPTGIGGMGTGMGMGMGMGAESMNTSTSSTSTPSMDMGSDSMNMGTSSTGMAGMGMGMGAESMNASTSSTGTPAMDMGAETMNMGTSSTGMEGVSMGVGAESMNASTSLTDTPAMDLGAESMNMGTSSTGMAGMSMGMGMGAETMNTSTSPTGTPSIDMGAGSTNMVSFPTAMEGMGMGMGMSMGGDSMNTSTSSTGTPLMDMGTESMNIGTSSTGMTGMGMSMSMGMGAESMNTSTPLTGTPALDMGAESMNMGTSSAGMAGMSMGMGAESMNMSTSSIGMEGMGMGLNMGSESMNTRTSSTGTPLIDMGAESMNMGISSTGMAGMGMGMGMDAESMNTSTSSTGTLSMDMDTISTNMGSTSTLGAELTSTLSTGKSSVELATASTNTGMSLMGTAYMDMGGNSTDGEKASYAWGIDDINGVLPSVPVYISAGAFGIDPNQVKVLRVDVDEVVDILFDNSRTAMIHPFHLHGHKFWVLGTAGKDQDLVLNEVDPVERDTVNIPQYGKAMIRIKFGNPGPWIMHCHVDFHMIAGMFMVILIGDPAKDWPVPEQEDAIRLCGSNEDFMLMMDNAWSSQFINRLVDEETTRLINSTSEVRVSSSASAPSFSPLFVSLVAWVLYCL